MASCLVLFETSSTECEIEVYPKTSTPVQATLRWNKEHEELPLRIKFSGGLSEVEVENILCYFQVVKIIW